MEELTQWLSTFKEKIDDKTYCLINDTLRANQFTSRLQLKLLTTDQIDLMFSSGLSLGAKTLLMYQLDLLKDESPLPLRCKRVATEMTESGEGRRESQTQSRRVSIFTFRICILSVT